jgi:uncharacterized paraquat-inducible protein A
MKDKKRICPNCNATKYTENKPFTCVKCGWKTIIEKNEKGENIQIN